MFAAITGISVAAAAIFSKIAVPEMVRQGYTPKFAVGLTAGSSLLGMLIPPSLLLIIYGVIAEVSIGGLFLAAVLPGILLAVAFAIGVILMAWLWPSFVGNVQREPRAGERGGSAHRAARHGARRAADRARARRHLRRRVHADGSRRGRRAGALGVSRCAGGSRGASSGK